MVTKYEAIDEARQLAATSSRTGDWVADFETDWVTSLHETLV
jgi:hypothetical protein